ncbi:hypothetical protein CLV35_3595 [Motilibacter peucedani]|uniref:Lipoprotein LprG n=1 Tax=Motilibacter peucedani TaxID=598650 RepID=A0A420XKN6_9ACTN|nr:hypothetical protein [Motilibacter peucedani]RKS68468.1 hypothetical protein CLV35_3595 [Motilibacter peucedani]
MRRSTSPALLGAGLLLALSACGPSDAQPVSLPSPPVSAGAPASAGAPPPSTASATPTARATAPSASAAATKLLAQVRTLHESRGAYRVNGTTTFRGRPIVLDVTVIADAARGSITFAGRKLKVIRIGGTVYAKGDPESFVDLLRVPAAKAETVPDDKWLAIPVAGSTEPLVAVLDVERVLLAKSPRLGASGFFYAGQTARQLVPGGIPGVSLVLPRTGKPTVIGMTLQVDGAPVSVLPWPSKNLGVKLPKKDRIVRL